MIPPAQLVRLLEKVSTLSEGQASKLLLGIAADVLLKCAGDGYFWLRFVKTRDEADSENPVKFFPISEPYLEALWRVL